MKKASNSYNKLSNKVKSKLSRVSAISDHDARVLFLGVVNQEYISVSKKVIKQSNLFDVDYYLKNNKDVLQSGMDPLEHYIMHGAKESRRPSDIFDVNHYLKTHPEVREGDINPLIHYILSSDSRSISTPTIKNDTYLQYRNIQKEYKLKYKQTINTTDELFIALVSNKLKKIISDNKKILVYPLSYPIEEVMQRPQHLFRYFSNLGIPCVIIENDATKKPYFKEIGHNIFLTNYFYQTIQYLKHQNTILYITYPLYSIVVNMLNPNVIIYDVIDDLSCFADDIKGLSNDHDALVKESDIVMYSSKDLYRLDSKYNTKNRFLLENGVWVSDFKSIKRNNKYSFRKEGEKIIGYFGQISNILDWGLIRNIASTNGVRLVFIGPKNNFVNADNDQTDIMNEVLGLENVVYVPTVSYKDIPKYAVNFDAAMIPFVISDITNPVSPLKLFEYMALGLKVFVTPTTTLKEYKKYISVNEPDKLVNEIEAWINSSNENVPDYTEVLDIADWGNKFKDIYKYINKLGNPNKKHIQTKVDIINVNFYDWKGEVLYKGGAERYVYDLANIIIDMGMKPRIIQNAQHNFSRIYRGIEIVGVATGAKNTDGTSMRIMSKAFNAACEGSDLIIASPIDLACEIECAPVIGINHGIHWDTNKKHLYNNKTSDYNEIFDGISNCVSGVAVDTNFINWTRTYDYGLGNKLKYIPNYYDKNVFKPTSKDFNGRLKFMYPRRLYEARGITITLLAFEKLLKQYPNIDLMLVGQTDDKTIKAKVNKLIKQFPGRVTIEEYDMDDMHKAYKKSHVALIPTLYAEGTSLSCIEAMATNNAIISTNIGGLANLVVDGFNGYLIEPNTNALIEAVSNLAEDSAKLAKFAENGIKMVECFEKTNWDNKWRRILETEMI